MPRIDSFLKGGTYPFLRSINWVRWYPCSRERMSEIKDTEGFDLVLEDGINDGHEEQQTSQHEQQHCHHESVGRSTLIFRIAIVYCEEW